VIGGELARLLSEHGYELGLTGRRIEVLRNLQGRLAGPGILKEIDLTAQGAATVVQELIGELGGLDLFVICAGVGFINPDLDWLPEKQTIDVNVTGFAAALNVAFRHFLRQGSGQVVGITSVAAIRGTGDCPAYNASKAFESIYLDGLRQKVCKSRLPITVTEIQPGFVDTPMAQGDQVFWVAPPEKAARQIYAAIKARRDHAYITRRWRLVAWLLKAIPRRLYYRL
jgi:short-subunit dehydrogenase